MASFLIMNADDFGVSGAVNSAVLRAHREGLLTSASLMVTGSAAREAVAMARDAPSLAVGLHLVLGGAEPESDPTTKALGYYFSPRARRRVRLEIEAQFEAFVATGLPLSHVDGHQHLHAHPAVLPIVVELALRYGAVGIRVPHDPFGPNLRADRTDLPYKLGTAMGIAYLSGVCRRNLPDTSLSCCEVSIGALMSGRMSDEYVIGMLSGFDCGSIEIYFHPSDSDGHPRGPNRGDLEALLSPKLRRFVEERGFALTTYAGLAPRDKEGSRGGG